MVAYNTGGCRAHCAAGSRPVESTAHLDPELEISPGMFNDKFSKCFKTLLSDSKISKMLRTAALATLCASAAAFTSPAVFSNAGSKVVFVAPFG
jgi:hypothetical protein